MARSTHPEISKRELVWYTQLLHDTFQKVAANTTTNSIFGCLLPASTTLNVLDVLELGGLTHKVNCETDEHGRPIVRTLEAAPKWAIFPFTIAQHPIEALAEMKLPRATLAFGMASEMAQKRLPLDYEGNPIGSLEDAETITGWQTTSVSTRGQIHTLIRDEFGQSHTPSNAGGRIPVQMLETLMRSRLRSSF
jgi:hypothetical protein